MAGERVDDLDRVRAGADARARGAAVHGDPAQPPEVDHHALVERRVAGVGVAAGARREAHVVAVGPAQHGLHVVAVERLHDGVGPHAVRSAGCRRAAVVAEHRARAPAARGRAARAGPRRRRGAWPGPPSHARAAPPPRARRPRARRRRARSSRRVTAAAGRGTMPAMEEIVPGVHVWHAHHDGIGMTVHSFYVAPARALIDPMLPPGGVEEIAALGEPPQRILLTIRHHYRQCRRVRRRVRLQRPLPRATGCTSSRAARPSRASPRRRGRARGRRPGGRRDLPRRVRAVHRDASRRARVRRRRRALARRRSRSGSCPTTCSATTPRRVKAGLRAAYARIADELEFDALLLAHGGPTAHGGRQALAEFATAP